MAATHDTHTRSHGLQKTYDIEYTALRYKISLNGKVLKEVPLGIQVGEVTGAEAAWVYAVADIEGLRGMAET